jgi:CzcA family heavy metal efflux pump
VSLSEFATRNIKSILFTVASLCLLGIVAYQSFPVSILPEVNFPAVVVIAESGDRPAKAIEATITRRLEDALTTVPNVKRISSRTKRGSTEIRVDFQSGTDVIQAEQFVNAKVNETRPDLPPDTKTETERMNATVFPVLGLTLDSKSMSQAELYSLAYYSLRPKLSRLPGVARVVVQGGREPEVEVVCDPAKLAAFKLSLSDVATAVSAANQVRAVGLMNYQFQQFHVFVDSLAEDADALGKISVGTRGGVAISLSQVADVQKLVADQQTVVSANGAESVLLNIVRQPSANTVALADAVKQEMVQLRSSLPTGARLGVFYDQSTLVKEAIGSVGEAVLIGGVLAVVVLLLFLREMRSTLVTAAIIPLTVLITFLLMRLAGLTLNLMTLGALAVGIGLVIDDAIVVVENVFKHIQPGVSVAEAVRLASNEIARPMISSTLTTVVVFLPLSLLQGVAGAFFSALAITLTIALMVSLALALLASPSLCAAFLTTRSHREPGPMFQALSRGYESALKLTLRYRWIVPVLGIGILGATFLMMGQLRTGFMPEMDEGAFILDFFTPPGSSLAESDRLVQRVDRILKATPEVESFSRRIGTELGFSITEANKGDYAVMLKTNRHKSMEEVIADVRAKVKEASPGLDPDLHQVLEDLIGDLSGNPQPIEVKLFGEDPAVLGDLAEGLQKKFSAVKGLADVQSGVIEAGPETSFKVDLAKLGRYGLTPDGLADQVNAALFGTVASNLLILDRQVPVRVRYPSSYRANPQALAQIPILTPQSSVVPLNSLGAFVTDPGTSELARENQRRLIIMTARLEKVDLGTAVKAVQKILKETPMPPGVTAEIGGEYQSQTDSFNNLLQVLGAAILLVYAVMVFQFGSFTAPTVVLLVMPLALFGAVVALLVTNTALNVSSFMGAIMLVGIVVKNGILLLDRAHEAEVAGESLEDAVLDAGRQRLRPILMTSLTAILGLFPLALGLGSGAEMQKPLAIAVIGGLTFSTIVTLVFAPALYLMFKRGGRRKVPS